MSWLLPVAIAVFVAALFARIYVEDRRCKRRMTADHDEFCEQVRAHGRRVVNAVNEVGDEVDCKVYRFPRQPDYPSAA